MNAIIPRLFELYLKNRYKKSFNVCWTFSEDYVLQFSSHSVIKQYAWKDNSTVKILINRFQKKSWLQIFWLIQLLLFIVYSNVAFSSYSICIESNGDVNIEYAAFNGIVNSDICKKTNVLNKIHVSQHVNNCVDIPISNDTVDSTRGFKKEISIFPYRQSPTIFSFNAIENNISNSNKPYLDFIPFSNLTLNSLSTIIMLN